MTHVKALDLLRSTTGSRRNKLAPGVTILSKNIQDTERWLEALRVQPGKHFLEVHIARKSSGLIDETKPRTPGQQHHHSSTPIGISSSNFDIDELTRIAIRSK